MKYEITLIKAFAWVIIGIVFIYLTSSEVILWLLLNAVRVIINKPYIPRSVIAAWFKRYSREILGMSADDVCDLAENEVEEFFNKEYDD